jgi:hypothetical protein
LPEDFCVLLYKPASFPAGLEGYGMATRSYPEPRPVYPGRGTKVFPICFCTIPWNDKNSIFLKGVRPVVPKVSKKRLQTTVCVVGLGYVGLPLAQDFSE